MSAQWADDEERELVAWLLEPANYPHRPAVVEQIETHISRVFLAGDEVFKLKKRVKYDFLDFTSTAAREFACREEVRLNARLAPHVYREVCVLVRDAHGRLQWGTATASDQTVVDWVVRMRRLPTERALDRMFQRGELTSTHIAELAEVLATFYRSLPPLPLAPAEYRQRYLTHVLGNYRELLAVQHHLPRGVVERVHGFQLQLLQLQPELLEERARRGMVVDGHGDLRPEHIVFSQPVAIFDCIEFNPEFRQIDRLDEVAFLAAECDYLGAKWVSSQLLPAYAAALEYAYPPVLLAFYQTYRSCVRAKVAALRADQVSGEAQTTLAAEAARHLAFADQYAASYQQSLLIAVGGLSGTGKSTLAAELASQLGCEWLRTDVIRRELFPSADSAEAVDAGIYSPAARSQVYAELFRQAEALLRQKISVVLDATFGTVAELQSAAAIARVTEASFLAVECHCQPEVAKARIIRRLQTGSDPSEARPDVYNQQATHWECWPSEIPQQRVDTEQPLSAQCEVVLQCMREMALRCEKRH